MGVDPLKNACIDRSTDIAARIFGGETMILWPRDSNLFNLNVGRRATVYTTFDVTPEEAIKDA